MSDIMLPFVRLIKLDIHLLLFLAFRVSQSHHYRRRLIGAAYRHIFNRAFLVHQIPLMSLVRQSIAAEYLASAGRPRGHHPTSSV